MRFKFFLIIAHRKRIQQMRIAKPKEEMIRRIYQKDMIRKKTT